MESKTSASLNLTGPSLDPDEISAILGVEPSRTWRTGDLTSPRAALRHKQNGWSLKSGLPDSADLEDHVAAVFDAVRPSWTELVAFSARFAVDVDCVVYSYGGDRPPIFFGKELVAQAAALNADIGVDLFIMP